jgi:hypothetical protein
MAVCSHCHRRKAKRRCPALGADLCPLCCGLLRGRSLRCPPACPHLARHRPYQEQKVIQKKLQHGGDVPRDDRLDWLILNIEALLERIAAGRPELTDRDAVLALESAREKIERARPTLLITEPPGRADNEPGELVFQGVERCRYEGKIVLPQPLQVYKKEEKLAGLDQVIQAVKRLAGIDLEARNYLENLARRFAQSRGAPVQGTRIIPVR